MTALGDMTEPPPATGTGGQADHLAAGQADHLAAGQAGGAPPGTWRTRVVTTLRRHWLVSVLLACGLVLRALALAAYHPAILYVDSLKYLYGASPGSEPLAYTWLMKVVFTVGDLGTVAALQHLAGLAMAAIIYVLLLRRGVPVWLAALATAPVLLDAYQVQMEQMIMPDVWFELMIVVGMAVLLWRPAVTWPFAVAAGLVLGASGPFKQLGETLIAPGVVYLLVACGGWRRTLAMSGVFAAGFAVPVLAYCSVNYAQNGHFWLAHQQPITGRLMAAADCATLKLPPTARLLCPTPKEQLMGPDWLEHSGQSPLFSTPLPPGVKRGRLIGELDHAIVHQQPLRVAGSIVLDSLRLFALTRSPSPGVTPISRWRFQTVYPTFPPWVTVNSAGNIIVGVQYRAFTPFHYRVLKPRFGGKAQIVRPLASLLRAYQISVGYTPGPVFALCLLLGLAASVLALVRRAGRGASRDLALAALLATAIAATLLFSPDVYEFSWRYQLPAVITLPLAGALGAMALVRRRRGGVPAGQADAGADAAG